MIGSVYAPPSPEAQPILYVDEDVIVVAKPHGLLSVPGRGAEKAACSVSYVQQSFGDVLVVHRLDMDTSGLLVFARHKQAQTALSKQFERRSVEKRYEAVVSGVMRSTAGEIDLPIAKFSKARPLRHVAPDGQEAHTAWRRISWTSNSSRLALFPKTGRSHQIRLHLQAIGHPVLGDPLYGDSQAANRLLLHAHTLGFTQPRLEKWVSFSMPAPF